MNNLNFNFVFHVRDGEDGELREVGNVQGVLNGAGLADVQPGEFAVLHRADRGDNQNGGGFDIINQVGAVNGQQDGPVQDLRLPLFHPQIGEQIGHRVVLNMLQNNGVHNIGPYPLYPFQRTYMIEFANGGMHGFPDIIEIDPVGAEDPIFLYGPFLERLIRRDPGAAGPQGVIRGPQRANGAPARAAQAQAPAGAARGRPNRRNQRAGPNVVNNGGRLGFNAARLRNFQRYDPRDNFPFPYHLHHLFQRMDCQGDEYRFGPMGEIRCLDPIPCIRCQILSQ